MPAKPKPENGGQPPDVEFPLDSFRDAAIHLRRPFTPEAVRFKVQATWNGGGLIVAYIDARLAVERLNLIVPHLWEDEYEPLGAKHLVCRLTVDDITRQDVGEGTGKGLYSDALKRAAVKFGVGVSLYAIPQQKRWVNKGDLEEKQGKTYLTFQGEQTCRTAYTAWLELRGRHAFGDPLDHGDAEDAQGDAEAPETGEVLGQAKPAATAQRGRAKPAEPTEEIATVAQRRKIFAEANAAFAKDEKTLKAIFSLVAGTRHSDRIPKRLVDAVLAVVAKAGACGMEGDSLRDFLDLLDSDHPNPVDAEIQPVVDALEDPDGYVESRQRELAGATA